MGTLRLLLSLAVVFSHLGDGPPGFGPYAVIGFYTLSGYLACLVVNERYGRTARGTGLFFLNRALRIYPAYWAAVLISLSLPLFLDIETIVNFKRTLLPPSHLFGWLKNIFIFGLTTNMQHRLVPPGWAIYVILLHYVLIGLFFGRSRRVVLTWFLLSVAYHVCIVFDGSPWKEWYYPIISASLPFSTGAFMYFYRDRILTTLRKVPYPVAGIVVLYGGNWCAAFALGKATTPPFFYANVLLSGLLVLSLAHRRITSAAFARFDRFFGVLSYPVFLLHWQAGAVMSAFLGPSRGPRFFLSSLPLVLALSWAVKELVEDNVEKVRGRIKTSVRQVTPP